MTRADPKGQAGCASNPRRDERVQHSRGDKLLDAPFARVDLKLRPTSNHAWQVVGGARPPKLDRGATLGVTFSE